LWRAGELQRGPGAELRAAGLALSTTVEISDPRRLLLDEAEKWGADCIFVGTRGHNRLNHWLLGSVATAVVSRAHCSVEVVRASSAASL
jgi:nucleotide-binding universal stress UspA family protein